MKINNIPPNDNKFTQIVNNIAKPPKRLYFIGKPPEKRVPAVAIVGSRKPTAYSREVTMMEISDTIRALSGNQWTLR